MAIDTGDIDVLDRAIASGVLKVRYADGREVTYHSLDELIKARAFAAGRLAGAVPGGPPSRSRKLSFSKD
ncbi:phage head-tail joining protein [Paludisphaera rhizosphaerae]|uniref:phage head-tail joining protein n=1 Tax=Paludisphaera rhizosphaerae TaxID=2711216 RepID=UPI0013EC82BD|nr:hypothetical protein [Paludisphaera rhizosphaerae]